MAIATPRQRENVAVAYGTAATYASLHTADPGTTGTAEVTGGSPAYARKALTWAGGTVDGVVTASATFDLPPGVAVTHVGLWAAVSGGTFLDKATAAYASQASQGTLTVSLTFTQS